MKLLNKLLNKSPIIETKRLIIREMKVSDYKDMYEYACREEVSRYLLWAPHPDRDYTKQYLKRIESLYRRGEFHDYGVVFKENGKFIGTCGFAAIDRANNSAEAGYVLNPDYWNMGIATEALSALIGYGFDRYDFNRIEARYMVENTASRRVMEKCGMTFEGIHRGSLNVREKYRDIGYCAILQKDYYKN